MRRQTIVFIAQILTVIMVLVAGCKRSSEQSPPPSNSTATAAANNDRLVIAVSIPPHAWLVEQITKDRNNAEIITIVPPGSGPESYQPTDAQVSKICRAKVFLAAGVPFENGAWAEAIRNLKTLRTVDLRAGIKLRDMESHSHGHEAAPEDHETEDEHDHNDELLGRDPHTWLTLSNLCIQTDTITDVLCELDPEHSNRYREIALGVIHDLKQRDEELRALLHPYSGRSFFVFHPAWGYFADVYGLKQVAIEIEGKNPTDHELTELQRMALAAGTKTIFVQPQISGFAAEAIASAIGGRLVRIDPLAPNVPENLMSVARALIASFNDAGG